MELSTTSPCPEIPQPGSSDLPAGSSPPPPPHMPLPPMGWGYGQPRCGSEASSAGSHTSGVSCLVLLASPKFFGCFFCLVLNGKGGGVVVSSIVFVQLGARGPVFQLLAAQQWHEVLFAGLPGVGCALSNISAQRKAARRGAQGYSGQPAEAVHHKARPGRRFPGGFAGVPERPCGPLCSVIRRNLWFPFLLLLFFFCSCSCSCPSSSFFFLLFLVVSSPSYSLSAPCVADSLGTPPPWPTFSPLTNKGDNTKPLPWEDDTFDLVLGRGVICCCGTTHSGGPCGVPANLTQFLCEVGRVLKPQSGKRRCQALLHGDGPGGDYHLWKAAARGLPPNVHATALFYNQTMRGLRIYKTAAASSGEGEAAIDASASSSSSSSSSSG